jgi:hypothetical protein
VNKLFCCYLTNVETKPKKLLIRYMSDDFVEIWGITQQTAISILMSEINISPKIYTMFENGFISEYIDVRIIFIYNIQNILL